MFPYSRDLNNSLDTMLFLTNCSFHTTKYSYRTVLRYGPNEMRSVQKIKVQIFSVWSEQQIHLELHKFDVNLFE